MNKIFLFTLLFFCTLNSQVNDILSTQNKSSLLALYSSLDPLSVLQNLTFYELYPESEEGKKAFKRALTLLSKNNNELTSQFSLPTFDLSPIISMVNSKPIDTKELSEKQFHIIDQMAKNLGNRKLKGHTITTKSELLALKPEEVDLSRALFLSEFDYDHQKENALHYYEACIDLMALQILARFSPTPSDEEKIRKINDFIFHEMQFRFPPHSLYAKNIDTYTFLPSVIDNRKGVCLGVCLLYLCIAQRLDLQLQPITPPGHIYLSYKTPHKTINIETTVRGIDIPTEKYLGIETKKLEERNYKEVIGLAFMNQASVYWQKDEYQKAADLYEKALEFLPDDPLLLEFLAYNYLFLQRDEEAKKILIKIKDRPYEYMISEKTIIEDFLDGKTNKEGIKAIFLEVDETRTSILKKRESLLNILKKFPHFRAGLLQLAGTYLQLSEEKKAFTVLNQYHKIDPLEPIINYYLSILCFQRFDFNKSWQHLNLLETVLNEHDHHPKSLDQYKKSLRQVCPTYSIQKNPT